MPEINTTLVYVMIGVFLFLFLILVCLIVKFDYRQWKRFTVMYDSLSNRESLLFSRLMYKEQKIGSIPPPEMTGGMTESESLTDEDELKISRMRRGGEPL